MVLSTGRSLKIAAAGTALALAAVGCGRSSTAATGQASPSAGPAAAGQGSNAGVFGSLGRICEPGHPTGPTARGLTDAQIRIGTTADPGAAAAPGLGQEFFDVADAFTKWCNAAGGINGRKIVLEKYDAKLFNVAQQMINACQTEFMLVGNGNGLDAAGVKPRLACKLGQIPAYTDQAPAAAAGLQVTAAPNIQDEYAIGPLRLLADAYPAAKSGVGLGDSTFAPTEGVRAKQAYESLGYKVSVVQEKPPIVDNFRPYMEQLKLLGAKGYAEFVSQDPTPEIVAANNVGYKPDFVLFSAIIYNANSVAAARTTPFPPTYVGLAHLPFELASKYSVLRQIKGMLSAAVSHPKYTDFTALGISAWTLWAKAATECGSTLTQQCVLNKAGSYTDWTAGGLFSPVSTVPGQQHQNKCVLLVRLTPDGFVYDKSVTKPTQGPYNCDARNVVKVKAS